MGFLVRRRLGRVSGLFCGLILVWVSSASAVRPAHSAGPETFAFAVASLVGTSGSVEQQPGVTNPGPCLWTIDSHEEWQAPPATLDAGASASASGCLVADDAWHVASVIVHAASADLSVSIQFSPQAQSYAVTPVAVVGGYEYKGCVYGPTYATVSALPEIAGSNGGHGVVTQVTVSVANGTGHAVRKVDAEAEVASHGFCRTPISGVFAAAGALWETGL